MFTEDQKRFLEQLADSLQRLGTDVIRLSNMSEFHKTHTYVDTIISNMREQLVASEKFLESLQDEVKIPI